MQHVLPSVGNATYGNILRILDWTVAKSTCARHRLFSFLFFSFSFFHFFFFFSAGDVLKRRFVLLQEVCAA